MRHVILKRLRQSELGWFKACRDLGRETGRQRGLNIDTRVLEAAFGALPAEMISVRTRHFNGDGIVEDARPLRHQQKNWRLVGDAVRGDRFGTVRPDDIVLIQIEVDDDAPPAVPVVTWDIVSQADRGTWSLFELCRRQLGSESSTLTAPAEAGRILQIASRRLRSFGGGEGLDTGDVPDDAWDRAIDWLLRHVDSASLHALAAEGTASSVVDVLAVLGHTPPPASAAELAAGILRRFGTDLLADPGRRALIAAAATARTAFEAAPPERWRRGNLGALDFVRRIGLPDVFAGAGVEHPPDHEDVDAFSALSPLHAYQEQVAAGMVEVLRAGTWEQRRAIVWLPTGTGKTRVTVETLLMECLLEPPRNCVIWLADRDELCEQAIESFRHVWMIRGRESRTARGGMLPTLRVIRLWGGRPWEEPPVWPTVVVASVQTLAQRLHDERFQEQLAVLGERAAAIVFDEAHHLVAPSWSRVLEALGLARTANYLGRSRTTAPPLFGLTATPARSSQDEIEQLSRRFHGRLIEPAEEWRTMASFQREGFLSHLQVVEVPTGYTLCLTEKERTQLSLWLQLPGTALQRAGADAQRTARIVRDLEPRLGSLRSVLLFACSVEHAHTIASVLERRGIRAAALDGGTSRAVRWQTIQRFRTGQLQVLVNYDLLATGFDAPNVDAVAIARPVASRVLFAQMVGRGLRGPRNGGTPACQLLDYRDDLTLAADLECLRSAFRADYLQAAVEA